MMEKINQQFASFQTVILHTMKEIVINMIPQITNQQRSTLLSPSPPDMLNTQPFKLFTSWIVTYKSLPTTTHFANSLQPDTTTNNTYQLSISLHPTTINSRHYSSNNTHIISNITKNSNLITFPTSTISNIL